MKVTLEHPDSKHGYPVILDDAGSVMEIASGVSAVLTQTGTTYEAFAAYCNIKPATLRQYGRRANTPANVLNMLHLLLTSPDMVRRHVTSTSLKLTEEERRVLAMLRRKMSFPQIGKELGISRQRAFEIAQAARGKKGG